MRKIFALLLALPVMTGYARQISPTEAYVAASDFFKATGIGKDVVVKLTKSNSQKADKVSLPYYIYNAGSDKGFVIISGDDRSSKILGYSDKGAFDSENIPPQLKALLEGYVDNIDSKINGKGVHETWRRSVTRTDEEGVLLATANWGQGYPYNADCPTIDGQQAPTGCVATAMAIMMKYHGWPESYDWSAMPDNTESDPIDYEKPNVSLSKLMKDAGEAVYMVYGPEESGAQMPWVGHGLRTHFQYSPECQFIYTKKHSEEENKSMLRGSLDQGYPVIYSGSGSGSHAFIIDGYKEDMYHVNWGWDGAFNGYFSLDALTPGDYSDFSQDTGMVLNIIPDKEGNDYSECCIDFNLWANGDVAEPINVSVADIQKEEPFHIIPGSVCIPANFGGEIGIALVGKDNKIKEVMQSERVAPYNEITGQNFKFRSVVVTSDIDPSDRLQVVAKSDADGYFKLVCGTMESPSYTGVTGNIPRIGKVKFDIGEGILFNCSIGSGDDQADGLGLLPAGKREVEILRGMELYYRCDSENPDPSKAIVFKANGKLIYGNMIMADPESIGYSIDVASDHELTVRVVNLHDERFDLAEAGTLKNLISPEEANGVRDLILSGKMNMDDMMYIRENMPCVRLLDMKDVTIEGCTTTDELYVKKPSEYFADEIPTFGLVNLHSDYIEEIILPDNITSIGSDSMVHFKIKSVTIPAGVTSIGLNAFYANYNLEAVELLNPEPVAINDCVFVQTKCPEEGTLYVPEGTADKYRQTPVWQDFKEIIEGSMRDDQSAVEDIPAVESGVMDVYAIDGKVVLKGVEKAALQQLAPGVYIIRQGDKSTKIAIGAR